MSATVLPEDYNPPGPWKRIAVRLTNRYTGKRNERHPGDMSRAECEWIVRVMYARLAQLEQAQEKTKSA